MAVASLSGASAGGVAQDGPESDESIFAGILADAERWISGYLDPAGIVLPDPLPARIKHLALQYGRWALYSRHGALEAARDIWKMFLVDGGKWLADVASGKEHLVPQSNAPTPVDPVSGLPNPNEYADPDGVISEPSHTWPVDGRSTL